MITLKRVLEFVAVAVIVGIYSIKEDIGFAEYASNLIVTYFITALIVTVLESLWESIKGANSNGN